MAALVAVALLLWYGVMVAWLVLRRSWVGFDLAKA
jgi:hypothetical protein